MNMVDPAGPEMMDVVVIGAGMAGLAAAYALRDFNVVVLEQAERVGGRIFSQPAGDYWLNFGAHMFGGSTTPVGRLATATGVCSRPISGRLMGISYRGRTLLRQRPEFYPLHLPLSLRERLAFIRMGIALRSGASRINALRRQFASQGSEALRAKMLGFENERTLSEFVGPLSGDVNALLTAFTERNGANPEEMSAGHGLASFANVWSRDAPGNNIVGGSSLLPQALQRTLGTRVRLGHTVNEISQDADGVRVRSTIPGGTVTLQAKAVIVAVPAFVARKIISGLPEHVATALERIRYGAFLTAGVLTRERQAMPWDDNYAVLTPARRFSVLFNMATTLRHGPRRPGGSLMLFRGAKGAEAMMQESDMVIEAAFVNDLVTEFPVIKGKIERVIIQRWESGAPFSMPGRSRLQTDLTAPLGRVFLAGDYLEFPNMEAAVTTGQEAATRAAWSIQRL